MPVEIPYIDPKSISDSAVVPSAEAKPDTLTVGKIALAVFLGNLMTGVVGVAVYLALR